MEDVKPTSELLQVSYLWQLNIKVWKQIISKLKLFSTKFYKLALLKITLITPLVGTILESSPLDQRKDIQSERPGSSDDSDSICSFTHSSYNSLSEGSYELAPWKGKLSMSWESIGPDVISSSLLLAPDNAGRYINLLMVFELS